MLRRILEDSGILARMNRINALKLLRDDYLLTILLCGFMVMTIVQIAYFRIFILIFDRMCK